MRGERELREVYVNEVDGQKNEYREVFDGKQIVIPANGYVVMERTFAVRFLGSFRGFDRETSSGAKPVSWRPARKGAEETVFRTVGEHSEPIKTPQRPKSPAVESADPIKELEHLEQA